MSFFLKSKPICTLGHLGEQTAANYLKKVGYEIICRNFTNKTGRRIGEIDIVAKDNDEIVFVEVKTRRKPTNNNIVIPEENINIQKLYKLKKIANYYIQTKNLWDTSYRFDAVSLVYDEKTNNFNINHIKSIYL